MTLQVLVWAGTIAGLILAVALVKAGRWLWRLLADVRQMLDDWLGGPTRTGVPERIAKIEAELHPSPGPHPSSGASTRAAINRVENGVRRLEDGLAVHLEQHRADQRQNGG